MITCETRLTVFSRVFLSSITGVLLAQYYIIARGELIMNDLYTGDESAVYHYYHGWNYRAYVAYIVGIIPNFYGFLNNMWVSFPIHLLGLYVSITLRTQSESSYPSSRTGHFVLSIDLF